MVHVKKDGLKTTEIWYTRQFYDNMFGTELPWNSTPFTTSYDDWKKNPTFCTVFTLPVSECVCMCRYTSVLKYCSVLKCFVEESHQLFGFLRLLPCLYSLSLHRSSDVLPRCLSLFACDPSQLLLYNGLLLLIPVQAHTQLYLHACCQAMIHSLQFLNLPLSYSVLSFVLVLWFTLGENPGKNESPSNVQSYPLWELQYLVLIFISNSLDIYSQYMYIVILET